MRSSTGSSSSRSAHPGVAAVALLLAAAACAHRPVTPPAVGRAEAGGRPRVVLLPIDNTSGAVAPTKELLGAIAQAFGDAVEVVQGDGARAVPREAPRPQHLGDRPGAGARGARRAGSRRGADHRAHALPGLLAADAGAHHAARVHPGRAGDPLDGHGLAVRRPGPRPPPARDRGAHRGHPEPGRGRARARPPRLPRRSAARGPLPDRRPPRAEGPVPVGGARRRASSARSRWCRSST